jgi:hypothetical protein
VLACCCVCRYASGELVQLSLVSLCLCSAWLCGQLGLSEELGAFMAGEEHGVRAASCSVC